MGVGIGTCCCDCQTRLNYVYVRPDLPIQLQVLRFTAQVKDASGSSVLLCSYGDFETNATMSYQSTTGGVHTFRQYNRWNGYDPGDRPPLNASITDITMGISSTYDTISGLTWLQKARIEWIEFRRIYGASSGTDKTWRLELNPGETKLVKVSGSCGCIKKFSEPLIGELSNRWVYPPDNFAQLRLFTGLGGFDPVSSKTFTMSVSGLTSPWDVLNVSGATLSYVSGAADLEDGFTYAFRHDGSVSGKSVIFECQSVREFQDVDIVNSNSAITQIGYIQISDGTNTIRLGPSNLAATTKSPDDGSDWSNVEWRTVLTYSGFGTAPDATAVVVTITETP